MQHFFPLRDSGFDRPLDALTPNFDDNDLDADLKTVLRTLVRFR